ncbi:MAG: DNA polymerase III subunit beta [Sedimentisphaerales bacterium]|jgi:DNA polymerase-3 subunit beta|nr:DNA polymerase III subunit beta [Sedimentisphaerales bacterium]
MKVTFNRAALAEALGLVISVVPSRTPKPVLKCVRIAASGKQVRICATNLEVGLNYLVSEVEITREGEVVVEANHLADIVRTSSEDVLLLEATESTCEIRGADSRFTIYGQDPAQYPKVPSIGEGEVDLAITLEQLQLGIQQCLFATAKESSRYAINGVLWEVKGKKLLLVATDGRRLARCRVALEKVAKDGRGEHKIIVPARTMALLEKLGSHDSEVVGVKLVDNQILISCANVVISSNLVEGNFPKYEDIIPTDYDKSVKLSTELALSAVRRASLLTSEESKGIKLSVRGDSLVFSGSSPEAGAAEVSMPIEYGGEAIDIGFNPQFLLDVLKIIREPEFELELGQSDRPGLIKSGAEFLYVLMPINLG